MTTLHALAQITHQKVILQIYEAIISREWPHLITGSVLKWLSTARIEQCLSNVNGRAFLTKSTGQTAKFQLVLEGGYKALFKVKRFDCIFYKLLYINIQCIITLGYDKAQSCNRCKINGNVAIYISQSNFICIYIFFFSTIFSSNQIQDVLKLQFDKPHTCSQLSCPILKLYSKLFLMKDLFIMNVNHFFF